MYKNDHGSLVCHDTLLELNKMSIIGEWIKQIVVYFCIHTMEYYTALK